MAKRTALQLLDEIAKPAAVKLLHKKCDDLLEQLAKDYPKQEVDTWAFQLREATGYLSDNTTPTPFIDAAIKAGESKTDYANLIVANNTAYSVYAGSVVKFRRDTEALISAASTVEDLVSVENQIKLFSI